MEILQTFLLAFVFSFLGSIPPGTLNLTALQLGLEKKMDIAWRFALAAALIEYPYAWLALILEQLLTSSPLILNNFKLISALVMIVLGGFAITSAIKPSPVAQRFHESGFRRGLILSLLNPLALPFWIGITAYLKMQGWVTLSTPHVMHSYLLGISLGAFTLLITVSYLAKKAATVFEPGAKVKLIPGIVLILLGAFALIEYILSSR